MAPHPRVTTVLLQFIERTVPVELRLREVIVADENGVYVQTQATASMSSQYSATVNQAHFANDGSETGSISRTAAETDAWLLLRFPEPGVTVNRVLVRNYDNNIYPSLVSLNEGVDPGEGCKVGNYSVCQECFDAQALPGEGPHCVCNPGWYDSNPYGGNADQNCSSELHHGCDPHPTAQASLSCSRVPQSSERAVELAVQ